MWPLSLTPERIAELALADAKFFGRGGAEVFELGQIIRYDLRFEELMDCDRLSEAALRIRELTTNYILTQW